MGVIPLSLDLTQSGTAPRWRVRARSPGRKVRPGLGARRGGDDANPPRADGVVAATRRLGWAGQEKDPANHGAVPVARTAPT